LEKLQGLSPSFVRKYGTITAGNASFLTDGAAAVLLMAEDVAKSLGYRPKARIKAYTYTAHEPWDELLLGPAFAIPKVLEMCGLKLSDIGVFELHEAFAAQIVATMKCLASDSFAKESLGKSQKVGEIPLEKLNAFGGSLSIGHPFGATGARLVTTAANRLLREKAQFAIVAGCAGGAMANAIVLENVA
jgi:acetyl-CoA acyltransferase